MEIYVLEKISELSHRDIKALTGKDCTDIMAKSMLSYYMLDVILKNRYKLSDIEIYRNEHGKPYIKDNPLFFSISHTKNALAVAVGENEMGVDIECCPRYKPAVARRVFSKDELKLLEAEAPVKRERLFTEIWTKKEAYAKFLGKGFSVGFKGINTIELKCTRTFSEKEWCLSVSSSEDAEIFIHRFELEGFQRCFSL